MAGKERREVEFADLFSETLRRVCKGQRFGGIEISEVRRGFPVATKEADIALIHTVNPIVFIETKRKGSVRSNRPFASLDRAVVGQAASYALLYKESTGWLVPYLMTVTPKNFAVFRVPERIPDFVSVSKAQRRDYENAIKPGMFGKFLKEQLILQGAFRNRVESVAGILEVIGSDYLKTKPAHYPLSYAVIGLLNQFVESVTEECEPLVRHAASSAEMRGKIKALEAATGTPLVKWTEGEGVESAETLTRMMGYVLANKLVFYRVLENAYRIPRLKGLGVTSSPAYLSRLRADYFGKATSATSDFEPIFNALVFDEIVFPDDSEFLRFVDRFSEALAEFDMADLGELLGFAYEGIIPPAERHSLGQFYTPPPVAEFIVDRIVESPDEVVLDPGVGSGTFLSSVYRRLAFLKTGRSALPTSEDVHRKILAQLFALDVNPFPLQLAAMTIAMKNVRAPTTDMNTILTDFFAIRPGQETLSPYALQTPAGEVRRRVSVPIVGAILGNPPYTRWNEIEVQTQSFIRSQLKPELARYKLLRGGAGGKQPGIYVFWILHATRFLAQGGRLGMIISNGWLQAQYGGEFTRFLKDNYSIEAVIDFQPRVFPVPLVATCILILRREESQMAREKNVVVFASIQGSGSIDFRVISKSLSGAQSSQLSTQSFGKTGSEAWVLTRRAVPQVRLGTDRKWIQYLTGIAELLDKIQAANSSTALEVLFDVSEGNTAWSVYASTTGRGAGVGGEAFYYLNDDQVTEYGLNEARGSILFPLIDSPSRIQGAVLTRSDWHRARAYLLVANESRSKLPPKVRDYVARGESSILLSKGPNKGRPVSESSVAQIRKSLIWRFQSRDVVFHGWYDLGTIFQPAICGAYGVQYWVRFAKVEFDCALDHRVIALINKEGSSLDEEATRALVAILSSSFVQLQAEGIGRSTGGGMIELDMKALSGIVIPDPRKLKYETRARLSKLAIELDARLRETSTLPPEEVLFGRATGEAISRLGTKYQGPLFDTIFLEIDELVGAALGLEELVSEVRSKARELVERRTSRAAEPHSNLIRSERQPRIVRPRKSRPDLRKRGQRTMDRY